MHNYQKKYRPLWKCSKRYIPPQTGGMIRFYNNIGCSESKVIFQQQQKIKRLYKEQTFAPRVLQSVSVRTLTGGQTHTVNKQKSLP